MSQGKQIAYNKKARWEYEILDTLEAGLVLTGSEVKSLRDGKVSFKEGYVRFSNGQAYLSGVHIAVYENAGYDGHEPERERKLLLNASEIHMLTAKVEQKGLTVVPLKFYLKNGRIKLEIGLAKGKDVHDRRDSLRERDLNRDMQRELAGLRA